MISVGILAGGGSRRMGQNKAFLPFLGVPLVERVATRLRPLCHHCFVVGQPDPRYAPLGYEIYPDAIAGMNALGGLYTALLRAAHPIAIVVGCDMPFVNVPLLQFQVDELLRMNVDAVVPRSRLGEEPLHGVYHCQACIPLIERALQSDQRRMISWMDDADIHFLDESTIDRFDPQHLAFVNINTPEDLARAETLAGHPDAG